MCKLTIYLQHTLCKRHPIGLCKAECSQSVLTEPGLLQSQDSSRLSTSACAQAKIRNTQQSIVESNSQHMYYVLKVVCRSKSNVTCECANGQPYQVFKHKKQLIILSYDLFQLHNTRMVELAQGFHFPQGHALLPAKELSLHLLDRHLCSHNAALAQAGAFLWTQKT